MNKSVLKASVYEVLLNKTRADEAILRDVFPLLDILPCNINLTGAEIELVGVLSRESRLKKALSAVQSRYDYIFIDSPPSLGLLTLNALVACQAVVVPIQCEFYALEGVSQLLNTINLIRENLNPELEVEGVVLTMADFRTNLTNEVVEEIRNFFHDKVYQAIIPRNVKLSEAPSFGKPVLLYDPQCIGARRYQELSREFMGQDYVPAEDPFAGAIPESSMGRTSVPLKQASASPAPRSVSSQEEKAVAGEAVRGPAACSSPFSVTQERRVSPDLVESPDFEPPETPSSRTLPDEGNHPRRDNS